MVGEVKVRKAYVIMIYVVILILASVGVCVLVWNDVNKDTIGEEYQNKYNEIKDKLLDIETYSTESEDIDIKVNVIKSNESYLVSTSFTNPKGNYKNLIILVIDQKEKASLEDTEDAIIEILSAEKKSEDKNLYQKSLAGLREEKGLEFSDTVMEKKYNDFLDQNK